MNIQTITYNLREDLPHSEKFYKALNPFAGQILNKINETAEPIILAYADFLQQHHTESKRSHAEYAIEFLTIGMTWQQYIGASQKSLTLMILILKILYRFRKKHPKLKPYLDPVRGFLAGAFFVPKIGIAAQDVKFQLNTFKKLIDWLDATGEFKDEVKRFLNWQHFLENMLSQEAEETLSKSISLVEWFRKEAKVVLGKYTAEVNQFLKNDYRTYRWREDEIFCGKSEIEYHVNMVASEIMNQGFRDEFTQTPDRVVLVPGCMRPGSDHQCQAIQIGLDIKCTGCLPECNVNKIQQLGVKHNFKVYIVPHSTSFTHWLKRWENSTQTGVVAVACVLNIVVGGYEMRELNIPSQCVLLDYCGCKKHWHKEGIATSLNEDHLLHVIKSN